jgi:hypothetical protein
VVTPAALFFGFLPGDNDCIGKDLVHSLQKRMVCCVLAAQLASVQQANHTAFRAGRSDSVRPDCGEN